MEDALEEKPEHDDVATRVPIALFENALSNSNFVDHSIRLDHQSTTGIQQILCID